MERSAHTPQNATFFEFLERKYENNNPELVFTYRVHFSDAEPLLFTERITLGDGGWASKLPVTFIKAMMEDLHLVLGISYYKLFCPKEFTTDIELSKEQAAFWNTMYTKGLGEFLYRNNLSHSTVAVFQSHEHAERTVSDIAVKDRSLLVGIGGGKDSIVSLELLADFDRTGFVIETGKTNPIAQEVADIASVPLVAISRRLDQQLVAGVPGSYNGHVPISAVYAFLGVLQAALSGLSHVVVSNEYSSNFGNLMHEGNEVNHQWSKSSEFEKLFQEYVRTSVTPNITYFSLLRPFYELRIVKMFVQRGEKYFSIFSSCNRNFTHVHEYGQSRWCGECPKCAFAFLMLSAFLPREKVVGIFKKDLFEDKALLPLFTDLLGYGTLKPFDCVGTFDESRVALRMAEENGWGETLVVRELLPLIEGIELSNEVMKTQQALTVPSLFRMLGMESVLILGYGKEGHANEVFIKNRYPRVTLGIADQNDGPDYLEKQHDYDLVMKTPVIVHTKVERQYVTSTELFFNEVDRKNVIGVTGSKGKSTTATLIYLLLEKAGVNVRLVGNIGVPALQAVLEHPPAPDELFVFELSSYQLEDLKVSPHIAVLTSLFPEHLDHHGSLEAYYEAKRSIVAYQTASDKFACHPDVALPPTWIAQMHAERIPTKILPFVITNTALRGEHNVRNAVLAFTVAELFGVTPGEAEAVFAEYAGLPHRLQHVGLFKEIDFYDDSISTTPESTIAGIRAIGNVDTIVLGGVDRGYDFKALEAELRTSGVHNIVLFPESGEHMLASEEGFRVLHTSSMDEAVQFAYANTEKGKVCLLSPSAPSYNLFINFEARGNAFKTAVEKYGNA